MSNTDEGHSFLHLPHRKPAERQGQDTPGADQFAEVRESRAPGDEDAPIVREDEHHEVLAERADFPSQRG